MRQNYVDIELKKMGITNTLSCIIKSLVKGLTKSQHCVDIKFKNKGMTKSIILYI